MKGVAALFFSARGAGIGPFPQLISLPCAAKIIVAINDRGHIADFVSLKFRAEEATPADPAKQVVTSKRGVSRGQPLEFVSRENFLHFSSDRQIEAVALLPQRIIHQEKAPVGEKAPQGLDLFCRERLKLIFAGDIKERVIEEVAVRKGYFMAGGGRFEAGALKQLFHERRDRQRMRVPIAAPVLDLGEDELGGSLFL